MSKDSDDAQREIKHLEHLRKNDPQKFYEILSELGEDGLRELRSRAKQELREVDDKSGFKDHPTGRGYIVLYDWLKLFSRNTRIKSRGGKILTIDQWMDSDMLWNTLSRDKTPIMKCTYTWNVYDQAKVAAVWTRCSPYVESIFGRFKADRLPVNKIYEYK